MLINDKIWVAQGELPCCLLLNQANRHGLIAGATGTGKTVTLKVLAESFSDAGVPVFMADVKGDVTGMAQAGAMSDGLRKRLGYFNLTEDEVRFYGAPCRIWDMLGDAGCPVRITISDMGPVLLSRLLGLTDVQQGVLNVVFRVADDQGMLLLDLKDLRSMLAYVADHAKDYETTYGRVSSQSVGAIQRALLAIEDQGGDIFFGEPDLDINDWFACDEDGRGYVNILNASKLIQMPQIYAMFLLWMLSTLFEVLPEVGDPDKPRFVFFFDEAHLLFDDMPKQLNDKIVQVVKLIRSKGVGVYFITQSPSDIPDEVLAQLSNRVQHGLRAYTPAEQKAVKAAAASFRTNPTFDTVEALQDLGTGEALVSFLDDEGRPSIVQRARVIFPACRMAAADEETIQQVLAGQVELTEKYGQAVDRESAYEMINDARETEQANAQLAAERAAFEKERAAFEAERAREAARQAKAAEQAAAREQRERQKAEEQRLRQLEREAEAARKRQEQAAARAERERLKEEERRQRERQKAMSDVAGALLTPVFGKTTGRRIARGLFGTKR
jgi:DNA helicase HerA-like ATPase